MLQLLILLRLSGAPCIILAWILQWPARVYQTALIASCLPTSNMAEKLRQCDPYRYIFNYAAHSASPPPLCRSADLSPLLPSKWTPSQTKKRTNCERSRRTFACCGTCVCKYLVFGCNGYSMGNILFLAFLKCCVHPVCCAPLPPDMLDTRHWCTVSWIAWALITRRTHRSELLSAIRLLWKRVSVRCVLFV